MAQGNDDAEVTTDADNSGERLMMLLRLRINSRRAKETTDDAEDAPDKPDLKPTQNCTQNDRDRFQLDLQLT
jgi:hypothetical protein